MSVATRTAALLALTSALVAVPGAPAAVAAEVPSRIADLNGNHPDLRWRDPDATGRAVLRMHAAAGKVCYTFRWQKMEVRGLYVHRRSTDAVVAELYDEAPTRSGSLEGCATELAPATVREMTQYPGRFRVEAFPYDLGSIAGTLTRP